MTKNKSTHPPEAYQQRDLAILWHVATYRIGLMETISQVIGRGASLNHIVRRLTDDGLLQLFSRKLPGGVSYVQLTERAAERLCVPLHRANPLGIAALHPAIAALTWSCLSPCRSYRVEVDEALEALPGLSVAKNHIYCVSEKNGQCVLSRVMLAQGGHREIVQTLEQNVGKVSSNVASALQSGQFQFVFLVESEQRAKSLNAAIERTGIRQTAFIRVDIAATSHTVGTYLRDYKKGRL